MSLPTTVTRTRSDPATVAVGNDIGITVLKSGVCLRFTNVAMLYSCGVPSGYK